MFKRFLVFLFIVLTIPFSGIGDTLFWTVSDSATIDGVEGSSLYSFLSDKPYDGAPDYNICYGARVVVKDMSGSVVDILDCYFQGTDANGNPLYYQSNGGLPLTTEQTIYPYWTLEHGVNEVDIGHPNEGFVGAEWNMSPLSKEMMQEYMFMIELGQDVWDSLIEDYNWNPLAYSDTVEGQWLKDRYTAENGSLAPPTYMPWTPMNYHTTPEPSSGLLLLMGTGILGLRRKIQKTKTNA